MTENKRFKSINCGLQGQYIKDNGNVLTIDDVVNRLNELNDENIELHIQNDFLKDENRHMKTVLNENMGLKKLLRKISNPNGEIWLDNGEIIRLKRIFKGEWVND